MPSQRAVAAAGALLIGMAVPAIAQTVTFDRPAYRLHSIGQRLVTTVRVTDASGRPVRNATPVFRVADPTVATVSARGEVVSRKSGLTRIWAIAGRDSGSAFVMVEQRAARFAFSPAVLRIDALKATEKLSVQISDSAGVPIAGANSATASCRSLNDRIVTISPDGDIRAKTNGATYIRCTDRGFADSIRVEVRQRPARATIVGSRSISRSVGDTFTVRVRAMDPQGDSIAGLRPTWVSMDPRTVSVDPSSGRALARAEGGTRLIAQLGDVADTASIFVSPPRGGGLLMAPAVVADTTPVAAAKRPKVSVNRLDMYEGETRPLTFTVFDTLQQAIANPRVTIRSTDTMTVAARDSGLLGKKVGQVWVTVRYLTYIDSAVVSVRDSAARATDSLRLGGSESFAPIVEPTYTAGLPEKYQNERKAMLDSIHNSGSFAPPTGKIWTAGIYAGLAAHSSNQSNAATANLIEDRSGVIYGGRTTVKPLGWMALTGDLRLGRLNSPGTIGEPLTIAEAAGDLTFFLTPWLGLGGGYAVRAEKTEIATQRWKIPRASITARTSFVGDFISTTTSLSVLPGASFSGMPKDQQPDIGMAGEAGLELRRGSLDAGLTYYVEKLPFPELLGRSRVDQFSSLRLRVGFKIGR